MHQSGISGPGTNTSSHRAHIARARNVVPPKSVRQCQHSSTDAAPANTPTHQVAIAPNSLVP
jgi:hypothetical protein